MRHQTPSAANGISGVQGFRPVELQSSLEIDISAQGSNLINASGICHHHRTNPSVVGLGAALTTSVEMPFAMLSVILKRGCHIMVMQFAPFLCASVSMVHCE
jgi:hypothetical protein